MIEESSFFIDKTAKLLLLCPLVRVVCTAIVLHAYTKAAIREAEDLYS